MVVRCKAEIFTVFECRCLLKDSLKIDVVARTLMKVMNNADIFQQTSEKDYFIGQNCFLLRYTKSCLIIIEDKQKCQVSLDKL